MNGAAVTGVGLNGVNSKTSNDGIKINTAGGSSSSNGSVSMLAVDQPTTTVVVDGGDDGDMGERVTDPVILSKWQRAATSR